jgi:hypothetical protein
MEYDVQQGCPLANPLFNAFFDHVVREALAACAGSGITVQQQRDMGQHMGQPAPRAGGMDLTVPVLMLADDLAVLAPSAEALQQFMAALEAACRRWGLIISTSTTECMLVGGVAATTCEGCQSQAASSAAGGRMLICDGCSRGWHTNCLPQPLPSVPDGDWHCPACAMGTADGADAWRPPVTVAGKPLAWVALFKYLGSQFHEGGSLDAELSYRIQQAAAAFKRLQQPVFQQDAISLGVRMQIYSATVLAALLYGCEAWALSPAQLQRIAVFHRDRLRIMLGVCRAEHVSIAELCRRCRTADLPILLARRQLRWLGHVGRMVDSRLAKQVFYSTMHGPGRSRRRGRPSANLPAYYSQLVSKWLHHGVLRAAGLGRGQHNWHAACQNRQLWETLCRSVR